MDEVEGILVLPSALKHQGITEADIEHALGFSLRSFQDDQDGAVMTIGPDQAGELLEVGHRSKWGCRFVVFHAMAARDKFLTPKERQERR
jgi:hypothetical protein